MTLHVSVQPMLDNQAVGEQQTFIAPDHMSRAITTEALGNALLDALDATHEELGDDAVLDVTLYTQ